LVHPYEDEAVVAGQGTIGLELAEQVPEAEAVLVPIGGGGLASGIGLALKGKARVIGIRAAPEAFAIADGIAVKRPGELTEPILGDVLDDVVAVASKDIAQAMVLLLERTKLVVEGAGAVGIAALMEGKVAGDGPVAVVLSGGNIDASTLITVMRSGLTFAGRHLVVRTWVPDRPGELLRLLELVAREQVNVLDVEHLREGVDIPVGATGIELTLLTRDEAHCDAVLAQMRGWGYEVERVT
jgi:threonine dehydratase